MFDQSGVGKQAGPCRLTRRDFLLAGAGAGVGLFVVGLGGLGARAEAASLDLDILNPEVGYPHAFFFRQAEGDARDGDVSSYEEFEKRYLPLDGIVGKVLNEENYYTGKNNFDWFKRFKQNWPNKMVLLHYNGTGRRATDEATTRFFSGHWYYYKGTKLTQAISTRTQKVLHVEDTSVFRMKRYRTGLPDDIAIVRVDANGKPRWETAEHVRLESTDRQAKTITVHRGVYGTPRRTFPRGSYLAAHVTTGPYRYDETPEQNIPLWNYNFSTLCPRNPTDGRNAAEALVDYMWEKFRPAREGEEGGDLASFDGIIFDVFSWVIAFGNPVQEIDVNTDGRGDQGVIGGVNTVSKGVLEFVRDLRGRLPNKLILADGHAPIESQRGFGILNGIESEGYADKYDISLDHLSRGENIFNYWNRNSPAPSFNFMNFRYKNTNPARWRNTFIEPNLSEDRSYRKLRLALASTLFTDGAFTYGGREPALPPEVVWTKAPGTDPVKVRVFDELWKGTAQQPHWLGKPLKPAVHLAQRVDRFNGEGVSWTPEFINSFKGEKVRTEKATKVENQQTVPVMKISATSPSRPAGMIFTKPNINVLSRDLFIYLRLSAEPLEGFAGSVPRRLDVYAIPAGEGPTPPNKEFSWAGGRSFDAYFYFQDVGPGTVQLRFEVEGEQPLYFKEITAHFAADGRYREFENGVVFANPSTRPYTFNVGALFRHLWEVQKIGLRRIEGHPSQHPDYEPVPVNDGSPVLEKEGEELTLPAKDGLFVEKFALPSTPSG